ncbi:MAG: DUF4956 domain-containing protein [Anaerolineales bacterium]|jgi:hypothetical protein|nr:DUF4956 domain-containing protein [Anaerolineales bacterium]
MTDFLNFLLNFSFNFLAAVLLVRFIYYPSTQKKGYVLTYLAFNTVIYFVMSFLTSIEIGIGVGFGLFAIFTILRYRTDTIPIREMTYLFVIAALPVMNSLGITSSVGMQLLAANVLLLLIMLVLEKEWGFHYEASKRIVYEKIELIRPDRRAEMLADLQTRTGLKIKRITIGKVDFLHDTANLKIYYEDAAQEEWLYDSESNGIVISKEEDGLYEK